LNEATFASFLSFSFSLTLFYFPSLIELERGNNSKKIYLYRPSLFSKERGGGGTDALTILIILTFLNCVRDAEGGEAGTASPSFVFVIARAKPEAISCGGVRIPFEIA